MARYLIPITIGAALGSLMGYYGQCSTGARPLTAMAVPVLHFMANRRRPAP